MILMPGQGNRHLTGGSLKDIWYRKLFILFPVTLKFVSEKPIFKSVLVRLTAQHQIVDKPLTRLRTSMLQYCSFYLLILKYYIVARNCHLPTYQDICNKLHQYSLITCQIKFVFWEEQYIFGMTTDNYTRSCLVSSQKQFIPFTSTSSSVNYSIIKGEYIQCIK